MTTMSLNEDDDVPFDLPDLPEYSSCEKNEMSIIGRILNPVRQKMSSLILEFLEKRVHTYNEWVIVLERWSEHLSVDFLQYIRIWVQIMSIPGNHYTVQTIITFGEFVGQVMEVPYDPNNAQKRKFVTFKVKFDISYPLRRSRVVNIPRAGGSVTLLFDYKRVKKNATNAKD